MFSVLAVEDYQLGLETIYEGYLLHYGRPRLFEPADADTALLLGDYLYAHGLVRIAAVHVVQAVADLAELISICAQVRAEGGATTVRPGRRAPRAWAPACWTTRGRSSARRRTLFSCSPSRGGRPGSPQ